MDCESLQSDGPSAGCLRRGIVRLRTVVNFTDRAAEWNNEEILKTYELFICGDVVYIGN
jgi:hypothetical protein